MHNLENVHINRTLHRTTSNAAMLFLGTVCLFFMILLGYFVTKSVQENIEYKDATETTAVISHIASRIDSEGEISYTVYVDYYVDEEKYTMSLGYYSSDMRIGDTYIIKYLEDNPSKGVYTKSNDITIKVFGFILIIIIIIFIVVVTVIIRNFITGNKCKLLVTTGKRKILLIVGYELNKSIEVNHRFPYNIICYDEITDTYYLSNYYFFDYHKFRIETTINAYFDVNNKEYFYIDTKNYLNEKKKID